MRTYIDLMPYEIQEKIYREVFKDCMNELKDFYKDWNGNLI